MYKYKAFYLIFPYIIFVSSCKIIDKVGREPKPQAPFVELKNGQTISAKEVGQEADFNGNRIVVDGKAIKKKDVAAYSDGSQTYANIGKGTFARRIAEGKINAYDKYDYYSEYLEGVRLKKLYIQDSGSHEISFMQFKTLMPMIPANTPAGKVLQNYKKTRTIWQLTTLGGFGCFIAGSMIAGSSISKNQSDTKVNHGVSMLFGGMGIMAVAAFPLQINKTKLNQALAIHNGVLAP